MGYDTHLSLSWLVNQATLLSQHLAQIDNHVEGIIESMTLGNPWQHNTIKTHIRWSQGGLLAKEWELSPSLGHLSGKKLHHLHLKNSLKYKGELYLKQPLTSPQRKINVAYRTSNHRLDIETTLFCLISVGYHLELCIAITFYWEHHSLPK